MNILYCTAVSNNKATGLFWAIPNHVKAQSQYDNVFWYNLTNQSHEYWDSTLVYHSLKEFPTKRICDLPTPFNHPDLVVFESFYVNFYSLFFEVRMLRIPYVIIPHGALTQNAQKRKQLKKIVGNALFWNIFSRKAKAIHYLTKDEKETSGKKWNKNSFIMPNGVVFTSDKQGKPKLDFKNSDTKGVFIGRISMFHKGLDLLIEAASEIRNELEQANITIQIYGPDLEHEKKTLFEMVVKKRVENIIKIENEIFDEDKENLLINSDFFVLTSRLEGHPMGLIEALSYGLPCLITKGTNMKDEVDEYEAGWTADNTVGSIADAMKRMIKEKHTMAVKSQNAIELAKKYQWDEIAKKSHEVYLELCSK